MKYAWIGRHKNQWPITLQCEVLNVSASGYFEHQRRQDSDLSARSGKRVNDDALLVYIKAAHAGSKGEYAQAVVHTSGRGSQAKSSLKRGS